MTANLTRATVAAVLEAYTDEGMRVWLTGWIHADAERRSVAENGVLAEWSGGYPERLSPDSRQGETDG